MGSDVHVPAELLEESLEDLYEHAPCGYLSTLPSGVVVKVNETFLEWTGHRRADVLGRRFADLLTPGGRIYHETHYAPLLQMQGAVREIALDVVCAGGRRLPVLVNAVLRRDAAGAPVVVRATVFNATDRKRYERELLHARDRERAARERIERLQRITAALAGPLDAREVAVATASELLDATRAGAVGVAVDDEAGARRVLHREATDAGLVAAAAEHAPPSDEPLFLEDERGEGRARAVLPLRFGGRTRGVLELAFAAARGFEPEERAFLAACAGQCAQALERATLYELTRDTARRIARMYEDERDVADTLQRSLLAGEPPRDARFELAAYYAAGVQTLAVGGDWHDTFALGDDRIGVVVGDVVGRGVEAATAMGQLRSAVRALALADLGPAGVLERLDRFVAHVPAARSATVAYAELELDGGRLRYACAGHMPPVLDDSESAPRLLWDGRSPPLGAFLGMHPPVRGEAEATLPPGARLVLYTDGLVERRSRSIDVGLGLLVDEIARRTGQPVAELVAELPLALLDPAHNDDDVCLLAVALRGG